MATNKLVAAESIRTLATRYKDMVEVADLLESIGSIEQASKEASAVCAKSQKDRDEALAELAALKKSISSFESDFAEKRVDAKADIDLMLSSALNEKLKIIEEANDKADDILQKANTSASNVTMEARAKVGLMESALAKVMIELDGAVEAKNKAEEEARAAESKLKSVQDKIRKMASI